jgi:hypothetical protein
MSCLDLDSKEVEVVEEREVEEVVVVVVFLKPSLPNKFEIGHGF